MTNHVEHRMISGHAAHKGGGADQAEQPRLGRTTVPSPKRIVRAFLGVLSVLFLGCSGSVTSLDSDESDVTGAGGTGANPGDGSGGSGVGGGNDGPSVGGSPPDEPFEEPDCPDEPPPPVERTCDPINPYADCPDGTGCYPFLDYPNGEYCGHARFGASCVPAGVGVQGELCGADIGYCAPGFMCVVGATGGFRCGQVCEPTRDHNCPDGLICGETDIQGYGVCF